MRPFGGLAAHQGPEMLRIGILQGRIGEGIRRGISVDQQRPPGNGLGRRLRRVHGAGVVHGDGSLGRRAIDRRVGR